MENDVLNEILEFAKNKLKESYGYCGVVHSPGFSTIRCDDGNGNEITINFECVPEP